MFKYKYTWYMFIAFIIFILIIEIKQKNEFTNVYVPNNHLLVLYAINKAFEFECIFGKNNIIDIKLEKSL